MAWDLGLAGYDGWVLSTSAAALPHCWRCALPIRGAALQGGALAPIIVRSSPGSPRRSPGGQGVVDVNK
jgi:hypothetical protein